MIVYIVTTEQWDDMGNLFADFEGVFNDMGEALKLKAKLEKEWNTVNIDQKLLEEE